MPELPGWRPFRHVVKFRVTSDQLNHLNGLTATLGVSRSWLMRRALHLGLRGVLKEFSVRDFALRAARGRGHVEGPRRGPRGDLDSFAAFYSSDDLVEELPHLSQPEAEED
jgi:hypothetical protein